MATMAGNRSLHDSGHPAPLLSRTAASWYAWFAWVAMLVAPFLYFIFIAYRVTGQSQEVATGQLGMRWFVGSMIFLAIGITAAVFWRSYAFRNYWKGQVVAPKDYLIGMMTVWLVLEISGFVSLTGCLVTGKLMPCIIPAAVAFIFFCTLYPSGAAMVKRVGNLDDPARYEEPR